MAEEEVLIKSEKIIAFKRGLGDNNCKYNSVNIFKTYKKAKGAIKNQRLFSQIVREFYDEVVNEMLVSNFEFKLTHKMGTILIRKHKKKLCLNKDGKLNLKKLRIDWLSTKKLWMENPIYRQEKRLIYHMNEHTEGYHFRFYWDKSLTRTKNISVYKFIPTRHNKALLIESINQGNTDFYEAKRKIYGRVKYESNNNLDEE